MGKALLRISGNYWGRCYMNFGHPKSVFPPRPRSVESETSISMPAHISLGSCMSISISSPPFNEKVNILILQYGVDFQGFFSGILKYFSLSLKEVEMEQKIPCTNLDGYVKSLNQTAQKKLQMQGARIFRNEAYLLSTPQMGFLRSRQSW